MTAFSPVIERRRVLAVAGVGLIATGAWRAARAEAPGARVPIDRLNQALLAVMKSGHSTPFQQRFDIVAGAIDQAFDLPVILQRSIGPHWATMSAAAQTQLPAVFRRYTVANFVANFDTYAGETFRIAPADRPVGPAEQVVTTQLVPPTGSPTTLSYVMHETETGWRAVDVLADGSISRVAVQRSDFRSLLNRGGGAALMTSLQQKVADLSAGALA